VKFAAAICAALVGLMIVEFIARVIAPAYDPTGHVAFTLLPDGTPIGPPGAVRRLVKNTGDYDVQVRFNSLGLRDSKSIAVSGVDSIFVVGDSFGFGWGVEEPQRFSNLLEDRLGRLVFNISAGAADFDGYDHLIRYAETNRARIGTLVVSVCMENDLNRHPRRQRVYGERPAGVRAGGARAGRALDVCRRQDISDGTFRGLRTRGGCDPSNAVARARRRANRIAHAESRRDCRVGCF
jgi:hypothetical protein